MSALKRDLIFTRKGVYISDSRGKRAKTRLAAPIWLNALGIRESDSARFVEIRFENDGGVFRNQLFKKSTLLRRQREEIRIRLADFGYDWPDDQALSDAILDVIATTRPKKQFLMVRAPGWYGSKFVLPHEVFSKSGNTADVRIDPETDAHVGNFIQGEGSLIGWKRHVAKPSRKSSRARLAIAAAFAATLLRPLGLDSFGINWFSNTSDGKTLLLKLAASVGGLIGEDGLPAWADSEAGIEDLARGHRDCVMPLDEAADGEGRKMPLEEKARMLAFLIARNRPRKLSKKYERDNALTNREFRVIVESASERALGQIARDAGGRRLGGEEVRFVDVPASDSKSSGIFDGKIRVREKKTRGETTKQMVDKLAASAKKHQGYALPEFLRLYVKDPIRLKTVLKYKDAF